MRGAVINYHPSPPPLFSVMTCLEKLPYHERWLCGIGIRKKALDLADCVAVQ